MSRVKALVTGAPGWLGTPFVEMLCKNDYDVRCLVLGGFDTSNLEKLGVEVARGDVTRPETLEGVTGDIDTVFHAVGIIHPKFFKTNDWLDVNFLGTRNVLVDAIGSGVRRFVYISSNSVGGTNYTKELLMNEYTLPRPYMGYGKSKTKSERMINEVFTLGDIETVILRPCWFYGPGQPRRQTKLMQMIQNGKVPLFGNGQNLRSMTYISSLCEALMLAGKKDQAKGETYWIADERPYTTLEIYQTIASILGVELKVIQFPNIVSQIATMADWTLQKLHMYQQEIHVVGELDKNIACSIEKAKKDLGYQPKIALEEGMKKSIEWAKDQGLL